MKVKITKTEYNQMKKRLGALRVSKVPEDIVLLESLNVKADAYIAANTTSMVNKDILLMWYLHISLVYTSFFVGQIASFQDKEIEYLRNKEEIEYLRNKVMDN